MSLSAAEVLSQSSWLAERLEAAALQDVRQPHPETLVLSFRQPGENVHLVLATGAKRSRLHTIARPPKNPARSYAFQGLLRKELQGALQSLELVPGDRIVTLKFATPKGSERSLVAELTGRHGNFFLLDEKGCIRGAARSPRSNTRNLDSGTLWSPPPQQGTSNEDRFASLQGEQRDAAIRSHYEDFELRHEFQQLQQRLRSILNARRRQLKRTASKQQAEASRGDHAARLRREAELLQASFHGLRKGMAELVVDDYYSDPPQKVHLALDPKLNPGAQIEKRYQVAKRAERSGKQARLRLAASTEQLAQVEDLLSRLAQAETTEELKKVESDLPADLGRKSRQRQQPGGTRKRRESRTRLPYISYRTSSGVELRVGRGAKENDDLTFRHSRGNDVWLHVRGRPGAHVVICRPGPSPSPQLLMLGAQLALAHSSIKEGAREEVSWARVKAVRKPKGLPPGKVLVANEKVLYVEAERSALDALTRS